MLAITYSGPTKARIDRFSGPDSAEDLPCVEVLEDAMDEWLFGEQAFNIEDKHVRRRRKVLVGAGLASAAALAAGYFLYRRRRTNGFGGKLSVPIEPSPVEDY